MGLTEQKVGNYCSRRKNCCCTHTHRHTHIQKKQITYFPSLLFANFKEKVIIFFVFCLQNRRKQIKINVKPTCCCGEDNQQILRKSRDPAFRIFLHNSLAKQSWFTLSWCSELAASLKFFCFWITIRFFQLRLFVQMTTLFNDLSQIYHWI